MSAWEQMWRGTINPVTQETLIQLGEPMDEVWANDLYECQVRYLGEDGRAGMLHLSIKRLNRAPMRDWRHMQAIKNDVAGPEREAVELYPAESRLVDNANQFHLWVFPDGFRLPLGYPSRYVSTAQEMTDELERRGIPDNGKARQRPWQPGISTGPSYRP